VKTWQVYVNGQLDFTTHKGKTAAINHAGFVSNRARIHTTLPMDIRVSVKPL
jgi:hypothetical protein